MQTLWEFFCRWWFLLALAAGLVVAWWEHLSCVRERRGGKWRF